MVLDGTSNERTPDDGTFAAIGEEEEVTRVDQQQREEQERVPQITATKRGSTLSNTNGNNNKEEALLPVVKKTDAFGRIESDREGKESFGGVFDANETRSGERNATLEG